ncbi:MAG: DUF177 domain-containing protein [Verrucomicrobiae bacterium]|nr:DUF177 domain-containing protein [Verrucomicrobiae bacterium]NNJ43794.1 hypothetical protein [Akkermansiaceae bacterium]
MKKHLTIDLNTLPEEGKTFSGELDGSIFSFPEETIQAAGPMLYDVYVQKFDNEVLVRGNLSAPIEFTCVRTLIPFIQTIRADDCSLCLEATQSQIDLVDALRQEIVILFPDYPRCDEGDEEIECNLDSRYLAVDKPPIDDVKTPSRDEAPNPWDALDAIQNDSTDDAQ